MKLQNIAGGIVTGDRAAGLERDRRMASDRKIELDDCVRGPEGGIDGEDAPMRERGTHDPHVKLQGERHICRKQSASEDEGVILETRNRSADDLWLLLLCRFHQRPCGQASRASQ